MLLLLVLQAAAAQSDIQLQARVDIQELKIEKKGEASLAVHADPDGGSIVKVEAPKADGRKTQHNLHVTVDAQARIGANASQETAPPRPR